MQFCPQTHQIMEPVIVGDTLVYRSPNGQETPAAPAMTARYSEVYQGGGMNMIHHNQLRYCPNDITNPRTCAVCPKCKVRRLVAYIYIGDEMYRWFACLWEGCGHQWNVLGTQ